MSEGGRRSLSEASYCAGRCCAGVCYALGTRLLRRQIKGNVLRQHVFTISDSLGKRLSSGDKAFIPQAVGARHDAAQPNAREEICRLNTACSRATFNVSGSQLGGKQAVPGYIALQGQMRFLLDGKHTARFNSMSLGLCCSSL